MSLTCNTLNYTASHFQRGCRAFESPHPLFWPEARSCTVSHNPAFWRGLLLVEAELQFQIELAAIQISVITPDNRPYTITQDSGCTNLLKTKSDQPFIRNPDA